MCQLTLIHTTKLGVLKALLATQLHRNSLTSHQDGFGIHYLKDDGTGELVHSLTPPSKLPTLVDDYIREIPSKKYPVLAHVRRASTKLKDIRLEHAHPFYDEETGLVFAHNGTLTYLDEELQEAKEKEYPDEIDSQLFFRELLANYAKNKGNIKKALQKTMKHFWGKFAFLIKDSESNFYIVRGKADLHAAEIKQGDRVVALVINTELQSLSQALQLSLLALEGMGETTYTFKIVELEEETIYKLKGYELQKLGDIKQNVKVASKKVHQTSANGTGARRTTGAGAVHIPTTATATTELGSLLSGVSKLMRETGLTIHEVDEFLMETIGTPLCELAKVDLTLLNTLIRPVIQTWKKAHGPAFAYRQKRWGRALRHSGLYNAVHLYTFEDKITQFPYFLEDSKNIHSVELTMRNIRNQERGKN